MGVMANGLDVRIEGRRLVSTGLPQGLPLDAEDAPQLAREIEALCTSLRCPKPQQTLITAEFALRIHLDKGLFGRTRKRTLALGWPMLQLLDAEEWRVALALALLGETVTIGPTPSGSHDARVAGLLGTPLVLRTLTRLLAAEGVGAEHWWSIFNAAAGSEPLPPAQALDQLRQQMQGQGRAGWQAALDRALRQPNGGARIRALGQPQLAGGSHRSAAAAWFWEGLANRLWAGLEAPFVQLLSDIWQARHHLQATSRARVRELEARRREGSIEMPELIELARTVEQLAGARAAYPLYRQAYASERSPQLALALARTMASVDLAQARIALAHLAGSSHALAPEAELLLRDLPDVIAPAASESACTASSQLEQEHDH